MENNQSPSKQKTQSIEDNQVVPGFECQKSSNCAPGLSHRPLLLDLQIPKKGSHNKQGSRRVLISIKPTPTIQTIYIAERTRFDPTKRADRSGSLLAIGDNNSVSTRLSEYGPYPVETISYEYQSDQDSDFRRVSTVISQDFDSSGESNGQDVNVYNDNIKPVKRCYVFTQPQLTLNLQKENKNSTDIKIPRKPEKATLIVTKTSSEDSLQQKPFAIEGLYRRVQLLERKVLRQELVFQSLEAHMSRSSSDEESKYDTMRKNSSCSRAGCSYVEQYSHIPETSAFQRYAQQPAPLSPSKATTIQKEHNSEQYGRDFTTYDGITARGRRQCASVPCKRDDIPKLAAERVHKIRHKLNPVRDYRLMDTVHYLAQGEFAPRDDGIKLTPSREAVLSDIIYEDVCRTHWPNARLTRRNPNHSERSNTRSELQRFIDNLLRERVAHVERRRRRHYRIVKLNHRHENCRPLGKTGDIIVASHKNRQGNEERDVIGSDQDATTSEKRRWKEHHSRKGHKSHDRLIVPEERRGKTPSPDKCLPGPSYAPHRSPTHHQEPTCCYRSTSPVKGETLPRKNSKQNKIKITEYTSGSSVGSHKQSKSPRLVIKKDVIHRRCVKDDPNLEQLILLPTLVVRTPSNVKRQKKFNELYQRILNIHLKKSTDTKQIQGSQPAEQSAKPIVDKKDVGLNINITISDSDDKLKNKIK